MIVENLNTSKTALALATLIALLVLSIALSVFNYFNAPKIAFIDSAILLNQYHGAVEAREQLNKKTAEWQKNIKTLENELNELNNNLINSSRLKKKEMDKLQEKIKKKQSEYMRYNKAVSEKAAKAEAKLFEPIYAELNAKIADFAKEKGYDIILGTVSGGNILFGSDAANITEAFIKYSKQ
jgi:outer membrane protein